MTDELIGVVAGLALALPAAVVGAVIAEYELVRQQWPHGSRWRAVGVAVANFIDAVIELVTPSRPAPMIQSIRFTRCECSACTAAERSDAVIAETVEKMMTDDR